MISIFLSVLDHVLKFQEHITKVLDLKLFSLSALIIFIYGIFLNYDFAVQYTFNLLYPTNNLYENYIFIWPFGGYVQIIIILFIASILLNRKLFFYFLNKNSFFRFYNGLNVKINDDLKFNEHWKNYIQICQIMDKKYCYLDEESHLNGIILIYRRINQKFCFLSLLNKRNIKTANTQQDLDYQEKVMILSFIQKICDYVIKYNPEIHLQVKEDSIDKGLKEIQLENSYIDIISYCHIDGKGFLTTLALQNLIVISLLLPQQKRIQILELMNAMPIQNIGWLNRRLFEVILVNVALNSMSKSEWDKLVNEIIQLSKEISSIEPKLVFDERVEKIKGDYKEQVLSKYIVEKGFQYAP